jgi:hypothetical protein
MRIIWLTVAIAVCAAVAASGGSAARTAQVSVVASGLDHPQGIAFASDGSFYVTEMGTGGDSCYDEPDFIGFGPLGPACYGQTGAVTRIRNGQKTRVVEGLFSIGVFGGAVVTGPTSVAVRNGGGLLVTMTARSGCRSTDVYPWWARAQLGKLLSTQDGRHTRVVADLNAYECSENPDGGDRSSYPSAVLAAGNDVYVSDAGGESVLGLEGSELTTLGVTPGFGPFPLAIGPRGNLYVGVCNCDGEGKVFRVKPPNSPAEVAGGFGWITGLAFGGDGSFYVVSEHFDPNDPTVAHGDIVRITADGTRTTVLPQGTLEWPGQAAWGPDGALYVVNHAQFASAGEVVRIKP